MILIVGLGNKGKEFDNTYHNVGFMAIDQLCDRLDITLSKTKCKSLIFEGRIFDQKVVLAKPLTYMNNSGEALVQLTNAFKPEKTLVIYDDIDIEKGKFRYREKGSAGTHNGMRSIVKLLGTEQINRIRIGTKSEQQVLNLADYVLSKIDITSLEKIDQAIEDSVDLIEKYIKQKGKIDN